VSTRRGTMLIGSGARFLGKTYTYAGDESSWMRGLTVRVVAVLKGAARPDGNPDAEGYYLNDDERIARAGGIDVWDRVEVQPWMDEEKRFSFVTSDPRASDLEGLVAER
jgi:hypothetical protein